MDDFRGTCAGRKYPLIGLMGEELLGKPKQKSNLDSIIEKAKTANPSVKVSVPSTDSNLIIDKPIIAPTATPVKIAKTSNESNAR